MGVPTNGWFIMGNMIGGYPYCGETTMLVCTRVAIQGLINDVTGTQRWVTLRKLIELGPHIFLGSTQSKRYCFVEWPVRLLQQFQVHFFSCSHMVVSPK